MSEHQLRFADAIIAVTPALAQRLADRGVSVSVRKSRGRDIRAACGQLITDSARAKAPGQQMASMLGS